MPYTIFKKRRIYMRNLNCLRCGTKMEHIGQEKIQLGETGILLGDLPNLFAGSLKVDIYVCPECKKLEFYSAVDDEKSEKDLPKRTCPECGDEHDFDYPKCPRCKDDYYKR